MTKAERKTKEDRCVFKAKLTNGEWVKWNIFAGLYGVDMDSSTVCQCTGLKDKNGKLIYEGDILGGFLDEDFPEETTRKVVEWHENGWCTHQHGCVDYEKLDDFDTENFEVIGNAVDNPELLQAGE